MTVTNLFDLIVWATVLEFGRLVEDLVYMRRPAPAADHPTIDPRNLIHWLLGRVAVLAGVALTRAYLFDVDEVARSGLIAGVVAFAAVAIGRRVLLVVVSQRRIRAAHATATIRGGASVAIDRWTGVPHVVAHERIDDERADSPAVRLEVARSGVVGNLVWTPRAASSIATVFILDVAIILGGLAALTITSAADSNAPVGAAMVLLVVCLVGGGLLSLMLGRRIVGARDHSTWLAEQLNELASLDDPEISAAAAAALDQWQSATADDRLRLASFLHQPA